MTENTMDLYCDNILDKPQDFDWSEGYCDRWYVAAPDFEEMEAADLMAFADDYGRSLPADPRDLSREELVEGLESIGIACYDDESHDLLAEAYADSMLCGDLDGAERYMWVDLIADEYVTASEPMMNYRYPVTLRNIEPDKAAEALIGLPLTLIEDQDEGEYYLALTGGGMDLSAEICKAYIAVGQRPPVHFCRVPRMAGRKYEQEFIAVLIESCEVSQNWAQSTIDDLRRLAADPDYSKQEGDQ